MEEALKKLRTDLVTNAAYFDSEVTNACEAANQHPQQKRGPRRKNTKGHHAAKKRDVARAASWQAMQQFHALWNTLLDLVRC